jgi:hypothetical protein
VDSSTLDATTNKMTWNLLTTVYLDALDHYTLIFLHQVNLFVIYSHDLVAMK